MSTIHWYAFYPADYERDTGDLSLLEHGAYRRLMDHYYSTGRPIPTDVQRAFKICRAFAPEEEEAIRLCLERFFVQKGDGWHHKRIDAELQKVAGMREKASKAGKKSAEKRATGVQRALNSSSKVRSTGVGLELQPKSNQSQSQSQGSTVRAKALTSEGDNPPSPDDRTWLFNEGLHYLSLAMDREPSSLRSQVGKWLKEIGDDEAKLRGILQDAATLKPAHPVSWITAAIARRGKSGSPPANGGPQSGGEISADDEWRFKVRAFKDRGVWPVPVWGTPPDRFGCECPHEILAEFGFGPLAGRKIEPPSTPSPGKNGS